MPSRARDWFAHADRDLRHTTHSVDAGDYEWACFAAQQAAEKALKAVYQHLGGDARGHDLLELVQGLEDRLQTPTDLSDRAIELGKHYIATRYPNAHAQGAPYKHFTTGEAQRAITNAQEVLRFCSSHLA